MKIWYHTICNLKIIRRKYKFICPSFKRNYHVVCCVRDEKRFNPPESLKSNISVIEADLLEADSLNQIPNDIDGAYYLVHSMSSSDDYAKLEEESAYNFKQALSNTSVQHVIYLSGIVNEDELSKHLSSRKNVEDILATGAYHFTALRAGIIIGSGSASFEIIRDFISYLSSKFFETLVSSQRI